jgi:hypothetical protein
MPVVICLLKFYSCSFVALLSYRKWCSVYYSLSLWCKICFSLCNLNGLVNVNSCFESMKFRVSFHFVYVINRDSFMQYKWYINVILGSFHCRRLCDKITNGNYYLIGQWLICVSIYSDFNLYGSGILMDHRLSLSSRRYW